MRVYYRIWVIYDKNRVIRIKVISISVFKRRIVWYSHYVPNSTPNSKWDHRFSFTKKGHLLFIINNHKNNTIPIFVHRNTMIHFPPNPSMVSHHRWLLTTLATPFWTEGNANQKIRIEIQFIFVWSCSISNEDRSSIIFMTNEFENAYAIYIFGVY